MGGIDMATIEERAKDVFPNSTYLSNKQRRAYAIGANDQKAIDIENACEWLKNNWREYVNQDRDGMILFGHWESDFRKAMGE